MIFSLHFRGTKRDIYLLEGQNLEGIPILWKSEIDLFLWRKMEI